MTTTKKSTDELRFGAFRDEGAQVDVNKKKNPARICLTSLAEQAYSHPVRKKTLTAAEVIDILKQKQGTRSDSQFAVELGISKAYLCDLYKGRRTPGEKILERIGLVKRSIPAVYDVV